MNNEERMKLELTEYIKEFSVRLHEHLKDMVFEDFIKGDSFEDNLSIKIIENDLEYIIASVKEENKDSTLAAYMGLVRMYSKKLNFERFDESSFLEYLKLKMCNEELNEEQVKQYIKLINSKFKKIETWREYL